MPALPASARASVRFIGHRGPQELYDFYANARMVVVPSMCFEGFPTVIPQAMLRALQMVASDVGGLADGVTGSLFPIGAAGQIADRINTIWSGPTLAESMGVAAREQAVQEYSRVRYYERLMRAFAAAEARRMEAPRTQPSSP
jgi:glycosyltransferase involved in cell wall biosynthesis